MCVGKSSFARMQNDIDDRKRHNRSGDSADPLTSEISRKNRYDRLLRNAKSMDFREIRETNIIYKSGQDKQGRSVFVFVGKNYSPSEVSSASNRSSKRQFPRIGLRRTFPRPTSSSVAINDGESRGIPPSSTMEFITGSFIRVMFAFQTPFELLCCYIIRMMDKEVASPFVVVYLHSMASNKNHVSYSILKELYQTLDYRYKRNLHSLFIVHPTWWSRVRLICQRGVPN